MLDDRNDRRESARHKALKGGRIAFNAGRSTIDCTIRNVSLDGAKLQVASVVGVPNTFDLVTGGAPPRPCRVIWRSLKELGIQFEPPDDQAEAPDDQAEAPAEPSS